MSNGLWLPEEDLKILADNFFDNLVEHIDDFPLEDIETADDDEEDRVAGFQNVVPPPLDVLTSLSTEFTCKKQASSSVVSSIVDSSPPDVKVPKLIQSSSPVSVLEKTNGSALSHNRKRIQRLGAEMSQQLVPDKSESETYLSSENSANKKRKKKKSPVRKCTHCETTRTPQWREGPCGGKTLCNACGVRFRSGRLVPEYRPASSPTFIPNVHSNWHRKIIQMRKKDEGLLDSKETRTVTS